MRLLVSVSNPSEAESALAGGADIIDAKDPAAGALGAVTLATFREICRIVSGRRPVSAALGDTPDAATAARLAAAFSTAGAAFVKVGFDTNADATTVGTIVRAAVDACRTLAEPTFGSVTPPSPGVIAAACADRDAAVSPLDLITIAAACGAAGVLLDTADKDGPGLCALWSSSAIKDWLDAAADASLSATLAGRLTAADLVQLRELGADIAGVRGAACADARTSRIVSTKVRALKELAAAPTASAPAPLSIPTCQ